MKTLNLSNRGITTPVVQERRYLVRIVKPSTGQTIIYNFRDRFEALKLAFSVCNKYKVYFVGVKTCV